MSNTSPAPPSNRAAFAPLDHDRTGLERQAEPGQLILRDRIGDHGVTVCRGVEKQCSSKIPERRADRPVNRL
jgi:hypothetical protein